jgi:hypothetical protein
MIKPYKCGNERAMNGKTKPLISDNWKIYMRLEFTNLGQCLEGSGYQPFADHGLQQNYGTASIPRDCDI